MVYYGQSVFDAFQNVCAQFPDKTAIFGNAHKLTFSELSEASSRFANEIAPHVTGHVVGLQIDDPIAFMVAYFALAQCKARLVLVDPRITEAQRLDLLGDLAVDVLLVAQGERDLTRDGVALTGSKAASYCLYSTNGWVRPSPNACYTSTDFVVHTTSGSTGKPKGIALSAENVLARIASWQSSTGMVSSDTILCMLTLSHCHGIEILMLPALFAGCTVVAPSLSMLTGRRLARLIQDQGVTLVSTLPWFYALMNETVSPGNFDLSSIRMMISASAKIEQPVATEFHEKFGIQIRQAYGLSEIAAILLDRDGVDSALAGVPLDGVEVRLANASADGSEGELIARGSGLSRGYVNAPDAQAEMFRDGWLWSQDIVRRETDGYRIIGRRSRFINVSGNNVAPTQVEDVLIAHPAVRDVAVKGSPDPVEGEQIVAFVVWADQPDLSGLKAHARRQMAPFCQPRQWITQDALPRNSIGKVMLTQLKVPPAVQPPMIQD